MAPSEKAGKKTDMTTATWYGQIGVFVVCSLFFVYGWKNGMQRDPAFFYLIVSALMVVLGALNNAVAPLGIRGLVTLVIVMTGTFLVPLSLHAYGQPVQVAVAGSLLYVMVCFALSPRIVAIGAVVAAVAFSCYLHYKKNVFEKYPIFREQLVRDEIMLEDKGIPTLKEEVKIKYIKTPREMSIQAVSALPEVYGDADSWEYLYLANKAQIKNPKHPVLAGARLAVPELPALPYADFTKIALAYLAAAALGFCWRLLVERMYQLYMMAFSKSSETVRKDFDEVKKQLDESGKQYRLLKEETSVHMLEMKAIINAKKE